VTIAPYISGFSPLGVCLDQKMQSKFFVFKYTSWALRFCSAISRYKQCTNCGDIVCPPFGSVPSCLGVSLSTLGVTLNVVESLAPGCSTLYFQNSSFKDWEARMRITFESAPSVFTDVNYHTHSSHLSSISLCLKHLEASLPLRRQIYSRLAHHQPTFTSEIFKVTNNLQLLSEVLRSIRSGIQRQFWEMLDSDVCASAGKLRQIMTDVSPFLSPRWASFSEIWEAASKKQGVSLVKNVSWRNFSNLGTSRWLDDELINQFVEKWCHQSTVLGLSSFFPVKFLFETEN
jgi:hypothetical protein